MNTDIVIITRCDASIKIGDDYGDNETTFRCQLKNGHKGPHQEKWSTGKNYDIEVIWQKRKKVT